MARGAEAKVRVRITDGGDLKKIEKGSRQADRALKGTARTSSSSTKNFSKMSQGITGGLVPAYATLAANLFAITAVFGALKEAADLRVMREGMIAYGQSTGTAMLTVSTSLQQVTAGMLDYGEAMKSTATLTAAGFNSTMIMEMGEAAKNASAALGHNFEDAFNRITKGIQKAEPELLDELGIVLRLDEATRKYAQQVGKTQKDLTLYERTVAVHNEVIGQATEKYGKLNSELKVSGMNQLAAAFDNVRKSALEGFAPIAEFFAGVLSKNIGLIIAAMGLFAVSMLKAAGIGDSLKAKTAMWAENAKTGAINARAAVARYNDELARSKMSMDELKANATSKLYGIVAPKTGGGKGAEMLRKGQFDELSKNKRILRSWKNTAKEHLLITKNMTDAEYQDFMQMVDDLLLEEKTFVQESKHWWEKWGLNVKEQLAEANIGFQKFKGKITKGTAALAKGMGKLMSLVGWASILTMMYKTLMDGWNNLHRTVETFIDWGDSLSDFFGSKGLDGISKWLKNITDDARKNTKGWIDYKKELLETKKISDDITKASDNLNDSFGEFQSIARELSVDFDKLGPTSERFIKAMKLMQSLNVGQALDTWIASIAELEKRQTEFNKKSQEFAEAGRPEGAESSLYNEYGLLGFLFTPTLLFGTKMGNKEGKQWDTELARLEQIATDAVAKMDIPRVIKGLGIAQQQKDTFAGMDMFDEKALAAYDPAGAILEILAAGDSPEKIKKILQDLKKSYQDYYDAVVKPGTAMQELNQVAQSYNKEMSNIEKKNFPAGYEKLTTFLNLATNNISQFSEEQRKNTELGQVELGVLAQMGVQIEKKKDGTYEVLTLEQALNRTIDRRNELYDIAWGYETRRLEIATEAIRRQEKLGVGTKLGGSLGKEIKTQEKIHKISDQILVNEQNMLELETKKDTMSDELYTKKETHLQNVHDQLLLNRRIEEESMKLQFKLVNSFSMAFENLFTEIAKGEKRIGEIFKDVTRMMLQQMAQIMAQAASIAAMKAMFGPSLFGVPIGGREGGVFSPPGYRSFAGGGIATGSHSGYLATLHGTEAVVPLGNDKSIPVKLSGDSISTSNITVNVSTMGGQQTTSAGAGHSERILGQVIAAAVQGEILDQQRPGGILSPYGDGGP